MDVYNQIQIKGLFHTTEVVRLKSFRNLSLQIAAVTTNNNDVPQSKEDDRLYAKIQPIGDGDIFKRFTSMSLWSNTLCSSNIDYITDSTHNSPSHVPYKNGTTIETHELSSDNDTNPTKDIAEYYKVGVLDQDLEAIYERIKEKSKTGIYD